jgi:hypothetical protein
MLSTLDGIATQISWKLILNVNIRWNSTFKMIKRAICLYNIINAFIKKEAQDWEAYYNRVTRNGTKPYPRKGKKKPLIINNALSNKD